MMLIYTYKYLLLHPINRFCLICINSICIHKCIIHCVIQFYFNFWLICISYCAINYLQQKWCHNDEYILQTENSKSMSLIFHISCIYVLFTINISFLFSLHTAHIPKIDPTIAISPATIRKCFHLILPKILHQLYDLPATPIDIKIIM